MNEILKQNYIKIVDFLAGVLGEHYEIVLHEIKKDDSSIIAIKNSHISGREVGAPLTDFALNIIKNKVYKHSDFELNYKALAQSKCLNGSTFFIKENNEIVGMLCINRDDVSAKESISNIASILGLSCIFEDQKNINQENLSTSVEEMIHSILGDSIKQIQNGVQFSAHQKEELIAILYKNNIFAIKSAVSVASKILKISEPTIYRYLKNIKN